MVVICSSCVSARLRHHIWPSTLSYIVFFKLLNSVLFWQSLLWKSVVALIFVKSKYRLIALCWLLCDVVFMELHFNFFLVVLGVYASFFDNCTCGRRYPVMIEKNSKWLALYVIKALERGMFLHCLWSQLFIICFFCMFMCSIISIAFGMAHGPASWIIFFCSSFYVTKSPGVKVCPLDASQFSCGLWVAASGGKTDDQFQKVPCELCRHHVGQQWEEASHSMAFFSC